ncbi:nuclear transport factor 2 family protein [Saccharothrix sp. BKS2]|uniref:nuclear transport factor 2 family protein n=1 Tax=Saccharothrix sp. BKS2 TaxID=3064400 RepID=UPI0039E95F8F
MEEGTAAQVRRYYERVDAGEVDGLLALFAPDVVYDRPGYPVMRGRDALAEFYGGQRVISSGTHTLEQVTAEESVVAVHGEFAGVLKDGSEAKLRFADFFTLAADGLISRRITFFHAPVV